MTAESNDADGVRRIQEWFISHGFNVVTRQENEVFWADLSTATGRLVASGYGRGRTAVEAAERARSRYIAEQAPTT